MRIVLGIESTCDETAASVVRDGVHVLSSVVASQELLHARYRGVVPEIASRAHIENILPVVGDALSEAGISLNDVDAVAVANRPGLIGSLLIGLTAAKTLAWAIRKPLVGVDHVMAHLYSVRLSAASHDALNGGSPAPSELGTGMGSGNAPAAHSSSGAGAVSRHTPEFPAVGLVVSGGHTAIYLMDSWTEMRRTGSTIDDAVGEAYDKVAAMLHLGYPGGPIVDKLAAEGDPTAIRFPRSMLGRESLDFSFSGLKTAVLYHVRGVPGKPARERPPDDREVRDIAASFQAACVDVLTKKLGRAIVQSRARCVIVGGGVSANRGLRDALGALGLPVFLPDPAYCTDNAAMIAGLGTLLLEQGRTSPLGLDAVTASSIATA